MPNTRQAVGYFDDAGNEYAIKVPVKYVTLGSFAAPTTNAGTLPRGFRLRKANLRTHVADSSSGAGDAHFLERKVPCNPAALNSTGALKKGATVSSLDSAAWVCQGHTGERLKNIQ